MTEKENFNSDSTTQVRCLGWIIVFLAAGLAVVMLGGFVIGTILILRALL